MGPVKAPEIGIAVSVLLIFYMAYAECYQESHVVSMKMAMLFGQFWLFVCAFVCRWYEGTASELIVGWVPAVLFGYSALYWKSMFIKRELKELPVEK